MKATLDQDTCIGCGLCSSICSDMFEMGDLGKATVKSGEITSSLIELTEEAKNSCPVSAIDIIM